MYYRFGDNPQNTWEIRESKDGKKITATYRGRVSNIREPIEDVTHDHRQYRLWKMFNNNHDDFTHMPDVLPLIFHMRQRGFEIVTKIRDSKYTFSVIE